MVAFARIESPHYYYAGEMAVFGPWRSLTPGRMCYEVGVRFYRHGILARSCPVSGRRRDCYEFRCEPPPKETHEQENETTKSAEAG